MHLLFCMLHFDWSLSSLCFHARFSNQKSIIIFKINVSLLAEDETILKIIGVLLYAHNSISAHFSFGMTKKIIQQTQSKHLLSLMQHWSKTILLFYTTEYQLGYL